ncbi:MAG: DNA polymerase II [Thiotrichaceae bacterium]
MATQLGYLLTRQWRDTATGICLNYWFASSDGPIRVVIENQQAVCFLRHNNPLQLSPSIQRKPLRLQTLEHEPIDGLYFNKQRDLNNLRDHLAHDKTQLLESEIKPTERYLMERFITAGVEIHATATQPIQRKGYIEYLNPKLRPSDFTPTLRWVSVDIETEDLRGKLYSIAVTTADEEQVFMVSPKPAKTSNHRIKWCDNEKQALQQFFAWIKNNDPDVIIGWNVVAFDLDFLLWKCKQLRTPFALGRGEENATILVPQQSGQMHIARISGRIVLDGITSLRGAFWSFESFALGAVAQELLGKDKLIQHESGEEKLKEIQRQYKEAPEDLAEYNLEDCRLVAEIFAKTDLFNFSIQRASMTGLAIDRQGGSTAAFDHLYLPRLHRQGYVAPDIGSHMNPKHSPGGFVMESQPGLYQNVLVLDFKSLYPSIIRTFKIDPLGLSIGLTDQQESNPIPGFLDAMFSRETHILPNIVTDLWQQRDQAKKDNNQPMSQAVKIIMNSFYGVLGSFGCRFFNPQLASSITLRGHEIIQTSADLIEEQGYNVIYGDTDSVFVLIGEDANEARCQAIGKQLQDNLNAWWTDHLQQQYQLESHLELEFETHYLKFLMPTIRGAEKGSKKRYAGMVNKQGKKQMVFKGLETVRTDWTPLAREFQQELYRLIFNVEPYKDFIVMTHDQLLAGKLDNKLTYSKRLRRPLESYTSTQPPQVKAARKMKNPGRKISYVITTKGPEPTYGAIENYQSPPDYQHYIDKQLAPVADSILHFLGTTFERITQRQIDVFDR